MSIQFPSYITTSTLVADSTITSVVLQLHGDGIAASTNSNFVDASTNTFVITRVGTPTQGSVNPFGPYWSYYFGGQGSYITSNSNPIATTQGTFTVETWIYMTVYPAGTAAATSGALVGDITPTAGTLNWAFGMVTGGQVGFIWYDGASKTAVGNTVMSLNTWYHIAVSVNANAISMYVNGVQQTLTGTTTLTNRSSNNNSLSINSWSNNGWYFSGYVSNLRITVSTALYSSTFTPPTQPLTTATSTQLLLAATNRFQDISTVSNTITVAGSTATVQRFSPFSTSTVYATSTATFLGSSYFPATYTYLSAPSASWPINSTTWTAEGWFYTNSSSGNVGLFVYGDLLVNWYDGTNLNFQYRTSTAGGTWISLLAPYTFRAGVWYHIAMVMNVTTLSAYVNGSITTSSSVASALGLWGGTGVQAVWIGVTDVYPYGSPDYSLNGYVSNFKISNTALYTGTSFTVPSNPLSATSSTLLLTCQYSNSVADASTNTYAVTTVGSTATVSLRTPFARNDQSTAATVYSGSVSFITGGDYLSWSQPAIGTIFTYEFWAYPTATGNNTYYYGVSGNGFLIGYNSTTFSAAATSGSWAIAGSANPQLNAWNHIALVRTGTGAGQFVLYLNGVSVGSATNATSYVAQTGYFGGLAGSTQPGYISNPRLTNGLALYTSTFTPPTAPLTTSTATVLLIPGINAGIIDTTMQNNLVTTPGAQINTTATTVKYGSGSMGFNGSGYASMTSSTNLTLGSGDFTIEAWVYTTIANQIFGSGIVGTYDGVSNGGWSITINRSTGGPYGIVFIHANTIQQSYTTYLSTGTWYHIAVTRASGTLRTFLNGTQVATGTYATADAVLATCYIGIQGGVAGTGHYGYIDDLRMTKGVARYVNTFTPPTQANYDSATISTTTFTTSFTTANNVYSVTSATTLSRGGNLIYTTATGVFGSSAVHVFTATGTSYFTASNTITVAFLVVGGGGGGGSGTGGIGTVVSGGGAGGVVTGTTLMSAGTTYTITVGSGGGVSPATLGTPGTTSSIVAPDGTNIKGLGGGGGAGPTGNGLPGGSGGAGAGGTGTPTAVGGTALQTTTNQTVISGTYNNYGFPGGASVPSNCGTGGSGGGGAGAKGTNGANNFVGVGGVGIQYNIVGTSTYYAGGGGGAGNNTTGAAGGLGGGGAGSIAPGVPTSLGIPGTAGTGGGGGGGNTQVTPGLGGTGGPGIVVISYAYTGTVTTITSTGTVQTYNYVNGRWTLRPFNTGTLDISYGAFANQANTATTALAVSAGCTGQRSLPTQTGAVRFNSALNVVETYNTTYNTWTSLTAGIPYTIEYLAVAAGGGASATAGGGAGGVLAGFASVTTGNVYTVAVGQGGSGAGGVSYIINNANSTAQVTGQQAQGGDSIYSTSTGIFSGTSYVHIFTSTGTSYFTASNAITVAYLVVAGGGGGGRYGGGGGAGGLVTGTFTATVGTVYTVQVGSGGAGWPGCSQSGGNAGSGRFSSISSGTTVISTATGGGGAGTYGNPSGSPGLPGGSGGGGGASNTGGPTTGGNGVPGQGNPGSGSVAPVNTNPAGGGGGAGGAGGPGGQGGSGSTSTISGLATIYAGGGSGYQVSAPLAGGSGGGGTGIGVAGGATPTAIDGVRNTGGGGGGGKDNTVCGVLRAGNGGPGIVILSYAYTSTFYTVNSGSAIAFAFGGFAGTATGGASGAGIVGQGFTAGSTLGAGAYSAAGTGIYSQVTGAQITYGAGGAATGSSPGGTNTGNGGSAPGGTGAPGVVYIRYTGGQRGTGGTVSTVGTYTLHTFISTGTYTS